MTDNHEGQALEVGGFYWVLIALDPDASGAWENERMPARYEGNGAWRYLGTEGVSDWPVRWVGPRIVNAIEK